MTHAAVVMATFNATTDVPITANGYTATGNSINFTLNFIPVTGSALTVVNNTGLPFISGTFSNLAKGQQVSLSYGGVPYAFVADYFGGSGNDLVLQWADTRLAAWGSDAAGQMGNSTMTCSPVAAAVNTSGVLLGKTVTKIAAGAAHSLVLCSDGKMYAWGMNSTGQLGNGTTIVSAAPVEVDRTGVLAGKTVVSICCGSSHNLTLCSDGTLVAWGSNNGALGNNSTTNSSVPVLVQTTGTALEGKVITAISASTGSSFALCSDGSIVSWGANSSGQLGINNTTRMLVPVSLLTTGTALDGKTVTAISAGDASCLALCSDGKVVSWGVNFIGELGNNTITNSPVAVAVSTTGTALEGKTVKAIAAGKLSNSFALCTDGTLAAWGGNLYGHLGTGSFGNSSRVPVAVLMTGVLAGKTVVSLQAGGGFTQVLCSDSTIVTWGFNTSGQLGNNGFNNSGAPVAVSKTGTALAGKTVVAATVGSNHNLALCSDGTLVAWGDNSNGKLGTGGPSTFSLPQAVTSTSVLAGKTMVRAATGRYHSLVLCADGTLAACGDNGYGQLGNGGSTYKLTLSPVTTSGALSGKTVVAVAAGDYHSLALCSDGTMAAWGAGTSGQLGNSASIDSNVPVAVTKTGVLAGKTVVAISAGQLHNLALCSDGTLVSWGSGSSGQLGPGSGGRNAPGLPSMTGALAGKSIVGIAAGDAHNVVLCSDGSLAAWGNGGNGQLGNGSTTSGSTIVAPVITGTALEGKTVVKVTCGLARSLALCSDGTIAAWGFGYLGAGSSSDKSVAVQVVNTGLLAGREVRSIASSGSTPSFASCTDGTLAAWGSGSNGIGATALLPAAVDTTSLATGERFSAVFTSATAGHVFAIVAAPVTLPPPPVVMTLAASSITGTSATLNGTVTGNTVPANVSFDFGTSASYGSSVVGSPSQVGAGPAIAVNGLATGLLPNTTYHFRVNGASVSGTTHGSDMTFTTPHNNAALSGLTVSTGSLSSAFATGTLAYDLKVPFGVTKLKVTPTVAEPHASIQVRTGSDSFTTVASGSASGDLMRSASGPTDIQVKVTAEDTTITNVYVITVAARTALEGWKYDHFGSAQAETGNAEDFDRDGTRNLAEFAFGTDPALSANPRALSYSGNVITPGGITCEVIGGVPMAEFIRRSDYVAAGLIYKVEFSAKLMSWETSNVVPTVLATDGTYEVVGMAYPQLSNGARSKFFRVTVSVAP